VEDKSTFTALKEIKKDVAEIHGIEVPEKESETFKASVVLLSSVLVGPNIKRISKFTGYPYSLVSEFSKRLRENGVWKGGEIYANWMETNGGIDFLCDSCVAVGMLRRVVEEEE